MTKVQQFLQSGKTLEDLQNDYAIKSARHSKYPNLVQLKYSQIASQMDNPIVQECRGIILDEADNWRIVARGFDKFFNYGEPNAALIDWKTARVQEKIDGSLIMLYWYRNELQIATTGRPDASGEVNGYGYSFAQLAKKVLGNAPIREERYTYLLELTSPMNRVVVRHGSEALTLLAMRDIETGEYTSRFHMQMVAADMEVRFVREFLLNSFDDILATFENIDPLCQEGYVVLDADNRRVKVKHPRYVALHHMKEGVSPKSFLEAIRKGETAEVISAFPELEKIFNPIQQSYNALIDELEADYEAVKHIESQKEFAAEALKSRCSAALFNVRAGKSASIQEYLANSVITQLMRLLGMKDVQEVIQEEN